jgi:hypothetical protein
MVIDSPITWSSTSTGWAMRHLDTGVDLALGHNPRAVPLHRSRLRHWRPADARRAAGGLRRGGRGAVEAALRRGETEDLVSPLEAIAEAPLRGGGGRCCWPRTNRGPTSGGRALSGLAGCRDGNQGPGLELVEAYEALLRDEPVCFGASTTTLERRLTSGPSRTSTGPRPFRDRPPHAAAALVVHRGCPPAREAGDSAASPKPCTASGDGWRTGFDASAEVTMMLAEALDVVAPAPTLLRSRLLARSAVVRSHHVPVSGEAQAEGPGIARHRRSASPRRGPPRADGRRVGPVPEEHAARLAR